MIKKRIKDMLGFFRQQLRNAELRGEKPLITRDKIISDLQKAGIREGDTVFLHSSLKNIGYVEGGAKTVVDCYLDVLTPEGTLIVPAYYMKSTMLDTCLAKNYIFDVNNSPSIMGAIPNYVLKHKLVNRSIHPTHSVAAIGKNALWITENHHKAESTFGMGSPWHRLIECYGKLMGLGINMGPVTFYHALEDLAHETFPLNVKVDKHYCIPCMDWNGNRVDVTVQPLNPKMAKQRIDMAGRQDLKDFFYEKFLLAGVIKPVTIGHAKSWVSNANDFYHFLERMLSEGITIYSESDQLKAIANNVK